MPNKIAEARKVLRDALEASPDLKESYRSNIAMLMYDEMHRRGFVPKLRQADRNEIADMLLERIFGA